jgi:hypothetical protein
MQAILELILRPPSFFTLENMWYCINRFTGQLRADPSLLQERGLFSKVFELLRPHPDLLTRLGVFE